MTYDKMYNEINAENLNILYNRTNFLRYWILREMDSLVLKRDRNGYVFQGNKATQRKNRKQILTFSCRRAFSKK